MKAFIVIAMLIALTAAQTTVTPKTQTCVCTNLLNQADCVGLSGCSWTATNSINTTTTVKGTCANTTITTSVVSVALTFCGSVANASTVCPGTFGCAYLNSTCQIFTGCSAYVQTTNAACQAISTQCTTDGTRCVLPGACSTYTTQALCTGNIATSGARQCKWIAGTGTAGTCGDMICTDAPPAYNTLALCQGWISTCFSTGKGCVTSLGLCSSYTIAAGCTGMIGSDGACTASTGTGTGATSCRPFACTDAPATTATNTACNTFLSGCVTTGKGCISTLSACSSYSMSIGCTGLMGSDGACTTDTTTGAANCRALACTDAPASTTTDAACNTFKTGCQTTGSGCVTSRGACSSYQGTTTTCTSFIGTDGNCKGTGTTVGACAAKLCTDAPTTSNTDPACAAFQTGCVTTGAGCVASLGSCSTYQGTATTCTQYRGSDGNCTAPSSQTSAAACVPKICTDGVFTTNSACQAFSYQCVTNGTSCIVPGSCETIGTALTCQGSSACNSGSLCLNRSQCANYLTQSQCLLNQQQYVSSGTTYLRACTWTTTCANKLCTEQATTLTTDTACAGALAGCVTNGAGCVDISEACSAYQGTNLTCLNFKGLNGSKVCTQLQSQASTATCIDRTCDNATTANGTTTAYASTSACQAYLSTCYWDGNTGCTSGGCTAYFGLTATCQAITTAGQSCWQLSTVNVATTPCILKACSHAPSTLTTDAQCAEFLSGCVTYGAGCVSNTTVCTFYTGNLTQCSAFYQNTNQQCTKAANFCKTKACTDTISSPSAANCTAYLPTCAFNGTDCAVAAACTTYNLNTFALCNATTDGSGAACGWAQGGTTCKAKACSDAIPNPSAANCSAYLPSCRFVGTACVVAGACATYALTSLAACNALTSDAGVACGWATGGSTCTAKACTDPVPSPSAATCTTYLAACAYNGTTCAVAAACTTYNLNTFALCNATTDGAGAACGWATGATSCKAKACTDAIPSPSAATCRAYLPTCAFNGTACAGFADCTTYNLNTFELCTATSYAYGANCGWASGGTTCKARECSDAIPNPSAANCYAYLSTCRFVGTACFRQGACTTYALTSFAACNALTSNLATACGWATGGSTCTDKLCTDPVPNPSIATCGTYNSCAFNGPACAVNAACTTYTLTSSEACNAVSSASGRACAYATGETTCKSRACTDVISNPSPATCNTYLARCLFNGTSCITPAPCNTYIATGALDSDKTTFCNALTGPTTSTRCTYVSGANCANAAACSSYILTTFAQCILRRNTAGAFCGFTVGAAACSNRACDQQLTEASCNDTWLTGCVVNSKSPCATKVCSLAATTLTTNAGCTAYRQGCVTNGAGCIESTALCSAYQGTLTTCQTFTGGSDGLCNNVAGATSTTACIVRTCAANTTAVSNDACTTWKRGCVWTGTTGCKDASTCAGFNGTIDSCPTFTGSDGPCSGSGSTSAPCVSNSTICNQAPTTFSTHAQCQSWHANCITNGFGCMTSAGVTCNMIGSPTVCPLYKPSLSIGGSNLALSCDLASECLTKPTTCGGFTTAFQCNNVPISGSTTVTCAWSTASNSCINLTCALLPLTLTTDSACAAAISTCTTNGQGCVTKAACSTYDKIACGLAATTDTQKQCIWVSPVCRHIACSDNTTATSDAACNTYLTGCRTTGLGCSNSLICSSFIQASFCLKDQSNNPCLWFGGACINYTRCTDVVATTHANCQLVSPQCTTNGTTCIAITGCAQTILQVSCILGTDGNCGWLPAAGSAVAQCALYTSCTLAQGTTTAQCQLWGSTCVSTGTSCISKTSCSTYTTQVGCGNAGTDGICFYVVPTGTTTGTCRLQICSDATSATATSISTHTGCCLCCLCCLYLYNQSKNCKWEINKLEILVNKVEKLKWLIERKKSAMDESLDIRKLNYLKELLLFAQFPIPFTLYGIEDQEESCGQMKLIDLINHNYQQNQSYKKKSFNIQKLNSILFNCKRAKTSCNKSNSFQHSSQGQSQIYSSIPCLIENCFFTTLPSTMLMEASNSFLNQDCQSIKRNFKLEQLQHQFSKRQHNQHFASAQSPRRCKQNQLT